MRKLFVTGIGTDVGKTIVSAILVEALKADYWKPIQAGFDNGTDTQLVKQLISNNITTFFQETYLLKIPASPHQAALECQPPQVLFLLHFARLRAVFGQVLTKPWRQKARSLAKRSQSNIHHCFEKM